MPSPPPAAKPPAAQLTKAQLLELYHYLNLNRLAEEKLTNLYRQGKVVGGLYRTLGQEGCSLGRPNALEAADLFTPPIPNLGPTFLRGPPPPPLFAQYLP